MKKCANCGMVNEDYANFCNYCGKRFNRDNNQDTAQNSNSDGFSQSEYSDEYVNKIIVVGYLATLVLSWGWIPLVLLKSFVNVGFIGFVGFFLPFYMINSANDKIRKHGFVQLILCIIGCILGIYIMFR